jgi:hypothetical protein
MANPNIVSVTSIKGESVGLSAASDLELFISYESIDDA